MRILVIEDEQKVARALRDGFQAEGYDVVTAATGEEGFFLINSETFDVVILDLMLPGRDGLEVLSTLGRRGLRLTLWYAAALALIGNRPGFKRPLKQQIRSLRSPGNLRGVTSIV